MKSKTVGAHKKLKETVPRLLIMTGVVVMFVALLLVAVRSYTIEIFNDIKYQSFLVPSGVVMAPEVKNFSFAAVSDTGARNESIEYIINEIRESDAKFVLYLGDLVRYRNPSHFKWMADEIDEKLGGKPLYIVPGNHEIISANGNVDRSLYRTIFGQSYYWFGYGDVLFIGLDTSTESIDDIQLKWLSKVLTNIRPDYKFCIIYSHVPPVNVKNNYSHRLDDVSKFKLAETLKNKDVNLLMFGHVHYFSEQEFVGIPLVTLPSSGQTIRSEVKKFGYVTVKVSEKGIDGVEAKYIDSGNDVEVLESFSSNALVKSEINDIALWLFVFGLAFVLVGVMLKKCFNKSKYS